MKHVKRLHFDDLINIHTLQHGTLGLFSHETRFGKNKDVRHNKRVSTISQGRLMDFESCFFHLEAHEITLQATVKSALGMRQIIRAAVKNIPNKLIAS